MKSTISCFCNCNTLQCVTSMFCFISKSSSASAESPPASPTSPASCGRHDARPGTRQVGQLPDYQLSLSTAHLSTFPLLAALAAPRDQQSLAVPLKVGPWRMCLKMDRRHSFESVCQIEFNLDQLCQGGLVSFQDRLDSLVGRSAVCHSLRRHLVVGR